MRRSTAASCSAWPGERAWAWPGTGGFGGFGQRRHLPCLLDRRGRVAQDAGPLIERTFLVGRLHRPLLRGRCRSDRGGRHRQPRGRRQRRRARWARHPRPAHRARRRAAPGEPVGRRTCRRPCRADGPKAWPSTSRRGPRPCASVRPPMRPSWRGRSPWARPRSPASVPSFASWASSASIAPVGRWRSRSSTGSPHSAPAGWAAASALPFAGNGPGVRPRARCAGARHRGRQHRPRARGRAARRAGAPTRCRGDAVRLAGWSLGAVRCQPHGTPGAARCHRRRGRAAARRRSAAQRRGGSAAVAADEAIAAGADLVRVRVAVRSRTSTPTRRRARAGGSHRRP